MTCTCLNAYLNIHFKALHQTKENSGLSEIRDVAFILHLIPSSQY